VRGKIKESWIRELEEKQKRPLEGETKFISQGENTRDKGW